MLAVGLSSIVDDHIFSLVVKGREVCRFSTSPEEQPSCRNWQVAASPAIARELEHITLEKTTRK
jgi:hypothetical protein